MKKLITGIACASLCVIISNSAMAQMNFGVKAGLNNSWITTKYKTEPAEKPANPSGLGYHFGGYMNYMFTDKLGFRPELVISMRNTRLDETVTETFSSTDNSGNPCTETDVTESTTKYKFTYVDIPLLLNIQATNAFSFQVGPQVGFRVAYKGEYEATSSTTCNSESSSSSFSVSSSETKGLNGLDFGIDLGLTYELGSGLNFGARYERGLNSINSDTSLGSEKWNVLQISAGYTFGKK